MCNIPALDIIKCMSHWVQMCICIGYNHSLGDLRLVECNVTVVLLVDVQELHQTLIQEIFKASKRDPTSQVKTLSSIECSTGRQRTWGLWSIPQCDASSHVAVHSPQWCTACGWHKKRPITRKSSDIVSLAGSWPADSAAIRCNIDDPLGMIGTDRDKLVQVTRSPHLPESLDQLLVVPNHAKNVTCGRRSSMNTQLYCIKLERQVDPHHSVAPSRQAEKSAPCHSDNEYLPHPDCKPDEWWILRGDQ